MHPFLEIIHVDPDQSLGTGWHMRGDVDILAAPLDQRLGDVRLATDFDHLGDGPNEPYDLVVVVERALVVLIAAYMARHVETRIASFRKTLRSPPV